MKVRVLTLASALALFSLSAQAKYVNDPPPVLEDNKPTVSWNFGGFGSYGSGGVAVLYSGESHVWELALPQAVTAGTYQLSFWMVSDDHHSNSKDLYSFKIALEGNAASSFSGLSHGQWGDPNTWTEVVLPVSVSGNFLTVQIDNTSALPSSDWIAIDRARLTVSAVPEPSSVALMTSGLIGFAALARRRSKGLKA